MNRSDKLTFDPNPLAFLMGGGEMGSLIGSMDWSKTSLGPVAGWSQSLRTTVSICLASDLPICVIWGPGLVQLYNDGYRLICGGKHPRSMGQNFAECWKEAWPVIGEAHDSALAGDTAFLETQHIFLERHGYLEECFFTFSFSPIRSETGLVGGLFHPVIEMTSKMIGERRTRALRDLAARTSEAKTVDEALALSAQTLAEYEFDLPFVLLYALDADGHRARLVGTTGLKPDTTASPRTVDLSVLETVWPLGEVVRSGSAVQVDEVRQRVGPAAVGPYQEPPNQALALPIIPPGANRPVAVFIAGVSSRLPMDEAYRSFYDLLASGITTAVANARAHEEERRRSEALAELDRAKTAFFSNVSHEFRTPLTLMLGQVEDLLAHSRTDLTPNAADQLEVVNRNGLRLLRLVNSLLDFSRIEAGRARAAFQPTDLAAYTADFASVFRSAVERAGLALTVDCPPLDQPVYVDREMWEKVVLNLLSNAFKFTFAGEIAVTLRQVDSAAELVVRDTGTGVPAAEMPRLFERFHRVENARGRTHEGSGIGLALVQELVKLHGGTITAESEIDRGTTFRVSIPLGTEHLPREQVGSGGIAAQPKTESSPFVQEALRWLPEADPPHAPRAASPALEDDLRASASLPQPIDADRPRVLVADDNLDMRHYLERLLKGQYRVEAVPDGEAALAAVREQLPDLVLTDVMMPRLDGFGLLKALRADPRTAGVPVILLSARAGEESRVEGMEAGADDYVVKPFSARELVARIDAQVLRQRLRAAERLQADRLTEVFAQTPVGIAVLRGNEHRFEFVNDAYLQLLDGRAVQGLPIREALPELAGQGIFELLDDCLASGEVFQAHSMRLLLDDVNGTRAERFFDFVYQPTLDTDGRAVGVVAVVYDVSKLTEARREADRANRAKDEFLAMLGHELRNPLSPITTMLHVMRMKSPEVLQAERALIERQVGHLVRLVDDLLDVSRIASGKMELRLVRIDLRAAVAMGIETASPALERQRHRLLLERDNQPLWVMGDAARLAQVVSNLLVNASKFTPPGGEIRVHVHRASDNQAAIEVIDNGVGITEEMLPQVFDIFTQERQNVDRASGGLGLGLAIVKSLVRSHGGQVAARSQGIGKGSVFEVSIPLTSGDEVSDTKEHCQLPFVTETSGRVLVVDDNNDATEALAFALVASGLDVRTAADGPSALEVAKSFRPDFAILDIGLPVMDGYELAKLLRVEHPSLIRIALTGYGTKDEAVDGACFEARMLKPVDLPTLFSLLKAQPNEV